jgi:hypothetical protein
MNGNFQRVLDAIDAVPWAKIEHAYGPAADVPDLIRALTSPDVKVRNDAWYELHGNLWHQGTIYEASAHAVPVFLELLKAPTTPEKNRVLVFIALLFAGRSYWDVHQHLKITQRLTAKPGFQQKLETELAWVAATKDAVVKGREIYFALLRSKEVGTQIAAAYLLGLIGASDIDTFEEIIRTDKDSSLEK